jgi:signal transduction histidine kinase
MSRPWQIWTVFGLGLAVMLAAMAWLSVELCGASGRALLEENVRLALWRMESVLGPLVAQESGRPYFTYTPFYPAERAYTRMFAPIEGGDVRLPSPLLVLDSPLVKLHFQVGPDGQLSSPQVPTGNMRDLAESGYVQPERIERAAARLRELGAILERQDLASVLTLPAGRPAAPVLVLPPAVAQGEPVRGQAQRDLQEFQFRSRRFEIAANVQQMNAPPPVVLGDVSEGMMKALWVNGALVLARRIRAGGQEYVQGAWLDWPAVREWLLAEVRDLLPEARLEPLAGGVAPPAPAAAGARGDESRRLATLPVRLIPGAVPPAQPGGWSPVLGVLIAAWVCVVLASAAVAVLLVGTVSLSERRAAFVSAVTHEMRTPLTTFQMYTEMLREGMVADEEKRRRYLQTLGAEAERLAHLVENVLGYARLERGRPANRVRRVRLGDLLGGLEGRLRARTEQAGMALEVDLPEAAAETPVKADPAAVEQVLFNLVDNACKYAARSDDRRVRLAASAEKGRAALRVCDHGPGVAPDVRGRLFRPFSKSARQAAATAPGVGLGLALSRRLARGMGGDLRLEAPAPVAPDGPAGPGACFVLTLPAG